MRRSYAGGAVRTTLVSPITTSTSAAVLTSSDGWPDTSNGPFAAVIDRGTAEEEKVLISDRSGVNITFSARGYDGTQAKNHSAGATIEHVSTAIDHDEANGHIEASSGVHGLSPGDRVVGRTATETLANKTISGPLGDFTSLRRGGSEVATRTGAETLTNKNLTAPVLTGTTQAGTVNADAVNVGGDQVVTRLATQEIRNKTIKDSAIENTALIGSTFEGVGDLGAGSEFEDAEIVNLSKAQTLVNKTLTAPAIAGGTISDAALTNATISGDPVARRRFLGKYVAVTSNQSISGGTPIASLAFSADDGTNVGDLVEVMLTIRNLTISPTINGIARVSIWTSNDGTEKGGVYLRTYSGESTTEGCTVHTVFAAPGSTFSVEAYVISVSGPVTGVVSATSGNPIILSARPFLL